MGKVSACLHMLVIDGGTRDLVDDLLDCVVSFCTDMGTEIGIVDALAGGFWSWLKSQCKPQTLQSSNNGDEDALADQGSPDDLQENLRQFLWKYAMPIPGFLHILDNAAFRSDMSMKGYKSFETQIMAICAVFTHEGELRKFRESLVRRNLGQYACYFERSFPNFISWRWQSLTHTLEWILELEHLLRKLWDDEDFGPLPQTRSRRNREVGEVQEEIPQIIALGPLFESASFWAYAKVDFALHMVIERLIWWLESCPCHRMPDWAAHNFTASEEMQRQAQSIDETIDRRGQEFLELQQLPLQGERGSIPGSRSLHG